MHIRTHWRELLAEVLRDPFIPETIWVDSDAGHPQSGFVALSQLEDPQRWRELVAADKPVITQVDEGRTVVGDTGWSPSSSCSNGVMLTLEVAADRTATGRVGGDLAFMRLRSHRRCFYEPDQTESQHAEVTTTDVHGWDFFRMINSDQAAFAIGLKVPHCANSAHAGCGTKPKPPTTGGTTTASLPLPGSA